MTVVIMMMVLMMLVMIVVIMVAVSVILLLVIFVVDDFVDCVRVFYRLDVVWNVDDYFMMSKTYKNIKIIEYLSNMQV